MQVQATLDTEPEKPGKHIDSDFDLEAAMVRVKKRAEQHRDLLKKMVITMHYPNGGMCMGCEKLFDNCSNLEFDKMPRMAKPDKDGGQMVACKSVVKSAISWKDRLEVLNV